MTINDFKHLFASISIENTENVREALKNLSINPLSLEIVDCEYIEIHGNTYCKAETYRHKMDARVFRSLVCKIPSESNSFYTVENGKMSIYCGFLEGTVESIQLPTNLLPTSTLDREPTNLQIIYFKEQFRQQRICLDETHRRIYFCQGSLKYLDPVLMRNNEGIWTKQTFIHYDKHGDPCIYNYGAADSQVLPYFGFEYLENTKL